MLGFQREDHFVSTSENWQLYVKRYKPEGHCGTPVVLCHGLGANGYSLDLCGDKEDELWDRYSLASYLLNGGDDGEVLFDVWVPELRGRKASQTFDPAYYPEKYDWCVDTYIDHDVPDIALYIKDIYRGEGIPDAGILWVGKSMGGMIAYAFGMTKLGRKLLRGVVTIGSPVKFENTAEGWEFLFKLVKMFHPRRKSISVAWVQFIKRVGALEKLKDNICNRENIDEDILQLYIDEGSDNIISLKVFLQFVYFIKNEGFCRYPRHPWLYDLLRRVPVLRQLVQPYSYRKHLDEFVTPALLLAGEADMQAPPEDVEFVYENIGTKEWNKEYKKFSEDPDTPGTNDYGHLDINYGRDARDEVYPVIYEWLKKQVKSSKY